MHLSQPHKHCLHSAVISEGASHILPSERQEASAKPESAGQRARLCSNYYCCAAFFLCVCSFGLQQSFSKTVSFKRIHSTFVLSLRCFSSSRMSDLGGEVFLVETCKWMGFAQHILTNVKLQNIFFVRNEGLLSIEMVSLVFLKDTGSTDVYLKLNSNTVDVT